MFAVPGLCAQHLARSLSARLYTATMPTSDEVVVLGGKRKRKKGAEAGLKRKGKKGCAISSALCGVHLAQAIRCRAGASRRLAATLPLHLRLRLQMMSSLLRRLQRNRARQLVRVTPPPPSLSQQCLPRLRRTHPVVLLGWVMRAALQISRPVRCSLHSLRYYFRGCYYCCCGSCYCCCSCCCLCAGPTEHQVPAHVGLSQDWSVLAESCRAR